jgi:CBS domain-containing protein
MKVKEAMHNVTKLPSTTTIAEAARIMDKKVVGSVLAEEGNRVIGMMTERDILRKVVAAGRKCEETTIKDIMSAPIITIDAEASLEEASSLMAEHKIRRLIVTDNGDIKGIITARDIAERIRYSFGERLTGRSNYSRPSYGKTI